MQNDCRVVLLGTRPACSFALDLIRKTAGVALVAVVSRPVAQERRAHWTEGPYEIAKQAKIPVLGSASELEEIAFDFAVSVNYWSIIPKTIIDKAPLGIVNLHHSFNLSIKGRMCATKAIQNCNDNVLNFSGSTLHYINEFLDEGPIIQSMPCIIEKEDLACDVFNKTEILGMQLLSFWIPILTKQRVPVSVPASSQEYPLEKRDVTGRMSELMNSPTRFYNLVRSFEFSDHYTPAYYVNSVGEKKFLTIRSEIGLSRLIAVDSSRSIFEYDFYGFQS